VDLRRAPHQPGPTDVTLFCSGEMDTSRWQEFREEVVDCGTGTDVGRVILDLADVTYFDSSSIRALVGARERLLADGVSVEVDRPSPIVARVLEITGLDAYLVPSNGDDDSRGSAAAS